MEKRSKIVENQSELEKSVIVNERWNNKLNQTTKTLDKLLYNIDKLIKYLDEKK